MTKQTERELLELAAKAAGIEIYSWESNCPLIERADGQIVEWNPRKDNGDAFRLAIQLRMRVDTWGGSVVSAEVLLENRAICVWEKNGADAKDAARRAIVRAAAEIGRAMP